MEVRVRGRTAARLRRSLAGRGPARGAYTTSAKVVRTDEGGTVWVHIPGGAEETPTVSTAAARPGDTVRVRVEGHRAYLEGNMTSPATDDTAAEAAQKRADEAARDAESAVEDAAAAREAADEANKVAQATNQHFFADDNGAHVTDVTQDEWAAAVDDNFSDYDPDTKPYHNQLLNSLGILLRTALNNLVSITRSAIAFYDGAGNSASNIVARFGSDGTQIGLTDESHLSLDYRSMQLVDKEGDTYFHVSDLRMEDGSIVAEFTGDGTTTVYVLPVYPYSPSDGTNTSLTIDGVAKTYGTGGGDYTLADGVAYGILLLATPAAVGASLVLRYKPIESVNPKAFTFGTRNAITRGMGAFSATLGLSCAAMSDNTVALNKGTIAYMPNQTAIGTYNEIDDNGTYALIVGNGTSDTARSNAFAVKWDGTVETDRDIPWTNLPIASGWSAYNAARTPKYRRVGSLVEIRGAVKPNASTQLGHNSVTFANLPQGCRPTNMEVAKICQGSGVKVWMLTVDSDGNVGASRMRTMDSTSYQNVGTSEFMIFDVMFFAG